MKKSRRHALGQHFLASGAILRKIADAVGAGPEDILVEIGAGRGALTVLLAERAGKVIAVEKDGRLVPGLREIVPSNVEVVQADVLTLDFGQLRSERRVPALRAVGNLPYSISTPLLFRFLDERGSFSDGVFLLQKEVAERVVSGPGSKKYAPLGILLQNEFETRIAFAVPPGAFSPPPRVQSALVTLRRRPVPLLPGAADEPFRDFLKAAFAGRRKMLWNNLARRSSQEALAAAYASLGLARNVRAEALPAEALFRLFQSLKH